MKPAFTLDCAHVSRFFGDTPVLREVSFVLTPGRLVALFGPNGAGKSTLLRILGGALRPSSGTAQLGADLAGTPAACRLTGLLSHQSYLHPRLTVAENLQFHATLHGVPAGAATRALAQVQGASLAPRSVGELSQGMRQKAALARCLLHTPRLLLLDEPFASLDRQTVAEMRHCLATLRDDGMMIILSSHNEAQVAGIADGAMTLERGRLRV